MTYYNEQTQIIIVFFNKGFSLHLDYVHTFILY